MEVPTLTTVVDWSIFVLTVAVFCLLRPQAARLFVGGFLGVMGLVVHGLLVITNPEGYVRFAEHALLPFYRQIGLNLTEPNPRAFGIVMLILEVTLAVLILSRGYWVNDERMVTWLASYTRRAATPGAAIALERMNHLMDASDILHAIHVPTLAIGRTGDLTFPIEDVQRTAEGIPGARFVELPGQDHVLFFGDTERLLVEIEHFLKEIRDDEAELDCVLATVLFTDIVGSTERAAALGDREWRVLRDSHHARIRSNLGRFRGREVNTAGDGFLATFDGPIRAVRCAASAVAAVRDLGIQIRAGLHTGRSSSTAPTCEASRCTSARGSPRWPVPPRSSSPRR
jgi:Adenylate and Guanylate cyclase catalytic domain